MRNWQKIECKNSEFQRKKINLCFEQIIATKKHETSANADTNWLLDFDLNVLGAARNTYEIYSKQIRKEYSIYPYFLYRSGRKKVLRHFIEMPWIYRTDFYRTHYEKQAKENLTWELDSL